MEEMVQAIAEEALDIKSEMPGYWAEEEQIGGGAIEAVADQFEVGDRTAALIPELMILVRLEFDKLSKAESLLAWYKRDCIREIVRLNLEEP
jgi:hypothetical protein